MTDTNCTCGKLDCLNTECWLWALRRENIKVDTLINKDNKMKVHVICCNDSVEFAIIGNEEKAKEKMNQLSKSHFERNKWNFINSIEYDNRFYWHIHTVDGL